MNPASAIVWVSGLAYCLLTRNGSRGRELAIAYLVVFAILIAYRTSRAGYLSPAYPMLFAAGAVALESWLRAGPARFLRPALATAIVALGVVSAPFSVPVLSPESYIGYAKALRFEQHKEEDYGPTALPQHFADQFGWDVMAQTVARVYRALPPSERAGCAIFGQNYGEAGAIDVLGRRLGLPHALSKHNSYWLWGPGDWDGKTMIVLGSNARDNGQFFDSVEQVATIHSPYVMPYERDLPVFVCRGLKLPVGVLWTQIQMYI
jgi:hypothetical protein